MTLGTAYQAATTHDDVLSVKVNAFSKRIWFAVVNVVVVCIAKRVDGKWVGWIGESSATFGSIGPVCSFGPADQRAKLAAELGVS